MTDIAIIDYGSGNLRSVHKAFIKVKESIGLDAKVSVTHNIDVIENASHIVLPGVGAFADCAQGLQAVDGLWEVIDNRVRSQSVAFLGICVGMQLMAQEGHEFGVTKGFGWLNGVVEAIKVDDPNLKIPHMGWNNLEKQKEHDVLKGLPMGMDGLNAYFVHSYHMELKDDSECLATTNYGGTVTAMVAKDTMIGTQFHPEKSQILGLKLIENFIKWRI